MSLNPQPSGGVAIGNHGSPLPPAAAEDPSAARAGSGRGWLGSIARAGERVPSRLASALACIGLALIVALELRAVGGIPSVPLYYLVPLAILAWFGSRRSAVLASGAAFLATLALALWRGSPASSSAGVVLARLITFGVMALTARGLGLARLMLDFVYQGPAWRAVQKPVRVGARLLVLPFLGTEPPPTDTSLGPDAVPLYIEPGMAFGTASHPTTRMCLELVEHHVRAGSTVLDVGCGTGILAIAAAKLGAGRVQAIDIDSGAIQVARRNLAHNKVTGTVTLAQGSIDVLNARDPLRQLDARNGSSDAGPRPTGGPFDLILANLLTGVIVELLQAGLPQLLGREGVLIASGIRSSELESARAAILAARLHPDQVLDQDGWCAVAATKRSVER